MGHSKHNQPLWNTALLANPHVAADKQTRVRRMFAAIAPTYDLNNRLHSLGMDQSWRRRAVRLAQMPAGATVVDVACGSGDLALRFARDGAARVIGVDFTYAMLPLAAGKARRHPPAAAPLHLACGDAMALPLDDACADVVSIAFGIRNVARPEVALKEFLRILKPGGKLVILEFGLPANPMLRGLYNFYFRKILPCSATLISGDRTGAYRYLPESVNTFVDSAGLRNMVRGTGFTAVRSHPLTFGVCVCHIAHKP